MNKGELDYIAARIIEELEGKCLCGLQPQERAEMGHLMGMLRDTGGGDYGLGIELLRRALRVFKIWCRMGEQIGRGVAIFLLVSLLGFVFFVMKTGIVNLIRALK